MRQCRTVLMWVLGAALLVALPVTRALADPPIAPALKQTPGNEAPVPRAMPDLQPYWNFDPPKSPLFDINKLTISGDMRVRPEMRNNGSFGVNTAGLGRLAPNDSRNDQYVQQWMRLGINYAIAPDVDVFIQEQYAKTWGATSQNCVAGVCSNDAFNQNTANSLFTRQAWMMIRNLGVDGLSLKLGRQLLVMGNHRLFGHFDWANTGFSHDGITFQYNQPMYEIWGGWVRVADLDPGLNNPGAGVVPPGAPGGASANNDVNMAFMRLAWKPMAGLAIEPLWVYFKSNAANIGGVGTAGAGNSIQAHAPDQDRHTLGSRVAYRKGIFDATAEGYWQTGTMGLAASNSRLHINAEAFAAVAGVTFKDVPTSPRLGIEFNYASGDGNAGTCNSSTGAGCNGTANTFENFYPTNHIIMGYADVMAWKNMVGYSGDLQLKPTKESHFEMKFWLFRKANSGDCWYRAAQNCYFTQTSNNNGGVANSSSLAKELDLIYTLFFKDNKVAWQIGGSYLWAGQYLDQIAAGNSAGNGPAAVNQIWAYTQLHVNF